MKYNEKYDRYITKGGLVYRYSKRQDRLILCKDRLSRNGYLQVGVSNPKITLIYVHRLVYETFIGNIPDCMQIDHINTIKTDNRLENLRCVTHKENMNNPLTIKHKRGKTWSEFGEKFKEHYGINFYENTKLYRKEQQWYFKHKKCSWE